jgi:hypothetical protein
MAKQPLYKFNCHAFKYSAAYLDYMEEGLEKRVCDSPVMQFIKYSVPVWGDLYFWNSMPKQDKLPMRVYMQAVFVVCKYFCLAAGANALYEVLK